MKTELWWLVAGGWWLVAGGWWLIKSQSWFLVFSSAGKVYNFPKNQSLEINNSTKPDV